MKIIEVMRLRGLTDAVGRPKHRFKTGKINLEAKRIRERKYRSTNAVYRRHVYKQNRDKINALRRRRDCIKRMQRDNHWKWYPLVNGMFWKCYYG